MRAPDVAPGFAERLRFAAKGRPNAAVAKVLGVTPTHVGRLLKGTVEPGEQLLRAAAAMLGVDEHWLRTGEGEAAGRVVVLTDSERAVLEDLRALPPQVREHHEGAIHATADALRPSEQADRVASLSDQRARRVLLRLVGTVAARDESAQVSFDARQGGEDVEVELGEQHAVERGSWGLVRVSGGSMKACGIDDGDLLLVRSAGLGDYHRGDTVVARTGRHGMVVKRYGGQRAGRVKLESCGNGIDINGTRDRHG